EYLGDAFIPEPSGNLVKRLKLEEDGGLVTGRNAYDGKEFLTSTDERFRPVNAYTGPDGALYLVDMARGVIQHKGFLTYYLVKNIKDRDLEQPINLGRIWRIVPDGADPRLVKLPKDPAAIVPFLAHANGWVRDTAQRVLIERGDASVVERVQKVVAGAPNPQGRVQALWTLEGLKALTPEIVAGRLADPDEHVRATAVRLADHTMAPQLIALAEDPSPLVRLAVAFEISAQTTPEANQTIATILEKGGSPLLAEAVASGARGRELELMQALLDRPPTGDASLAKTGIFKLLADCIMNDRRPSRIAALIDFLGTLEPNSPRLDAILEGMAREPKGKNVKTKLIYLDAAPAPLASLAGRATGKTKSMLANIDRQLAWPDKPGVPPPPKIEPLTADQQAHFEHGKVLYATICAACHQANGAGLEGLAPPLLDSEWVLGPADRPIRIVTQGLTGPVPVAGATWNLEMPGLPIFSDEDVASILTYIRREWEHTADPVSPKEVASVREQHKDRAQPWTAKELTEKEEPKQAAR
ncbi:MAG: c-type cytochrome, partial [Chthoniobacteraceae bacterium]